MGRAVLQLTLFGLLLTLAASQPMKDDWDIRSFHINSTVTSRYATTIITSRVTNSRDESKEIEFHVQIPKNAFISKFRMFIDDQVYDGVVKTKEQAQQQYTQAVSRGQSAGIVSSVGRTMEEFKTSVTVAAHKKVTFELTYEELLKRTHGKYELLIHARPMQPVKDFKVDVYIYEKAGISYIDVEGGLSTDTLANAITRTHADKKAWVTFYPTVEQQETCDSCGDRGMNGSLVVVYDVYRDDGLGDIERAGGYFVHHFAPSALPRLPKNVVFVIDQSGSMQGRKAEQARTALMTFLNNLATDDLFGLVAFNDQLVSWKQLLVQPTKENLKDANYFAFRRSAGATNMNKAVLEGARMLKARHKEGSVSILILLTDGDPTSGETNLERIRSNVRRAIAGAFQLYCLGFGSDVIFEFLEKMSLENDGVARWIHEDDDVKLQLKNFFEELSTPLLTDVTMVYMGGTNLTQTQFSQYYNGSEIVVAGQIMDKDTFFPDVVATSGKGQLTFSNTNSTEESSTGSVAESLLQRVWAYLTLKQLLEEELLVTGNKTEKAKNKALELSLKYGFMNPLTSMVITKPLGQNTEVLHKPKDGPAVSVPVDEDWILQSIGRYSSHPPDPKAPVAHRFLIESMNQSLPLCYDIKGVVTLRLLDHPRSELKMYGFLDSVENGGFKMILIFIKSGKRLTVYPKVVLLTEGDCTIGHINEETISAGRVLVTRRNNEIEVSAEDIHVVILVHEKDGKKFLWPVVRGGASAQNNKGLLGLKLPHYTEIQNNSQTKLIIKGKVIPVKRTSATDYNTALPTTPPCWLINTKHALQRPLQDFIIDETE